MCKKQIHIFFIGVILLLTGVVHAISVQEGEQTVIINYRGKSYPVKMNPNYYNSSEYSVELDVKELKRQNKTDVGDLQKLLRKAYLASPRKLRNLLFKANLSYQKGQYDRCFEILEETEFRFPASYLAKTMKGSLYYLLGAPELAVSVWKESIGLNASQPGLIKFMAGIEKKLTGKITEYNSDGSPVRSVVAIQPNSISQKESIAIKEAEAKRKAEVIKEAEAKRKAETIKEAEAKRKALEEEWGNDAF